MKHTNPSHKPAKLKDARREYNALTYPGDLGSLAGQSSGYKFRGRVNLKKIIAIAAMVLLVMWLSVGSKPAAKPVGKAGIPSLKFSVMHSFKRSKNKQRPALKFSVMPGRLPEFSIPQPPMPTFRQMRKSMKKSKSTSFYQPSSKELST